MVILLEEGGLMKMEMQREIWIIQIIVILKNIQKFLMSIIGIGQKISQDNNVIYMV